MSEMTYSCWRMCRPCRDLTKTWIYLSGITTCVGLYGVSPKRFKVEKVSVKTKVSNAACDWPSTQSLRCVKCSHQWGQRSRCCMFMLWYMTNPWEHSSVCSHSARVSIQLTFSYRLREFNAHLASAVWVYYNSRAGRVSQEYCRPEFMLLTSPPVLETFYIIKNNFYLSSGIT